MEPAKHRIDFPPGQTVTVKLLDVGSFGQPQFADLMAPAIEGLPAFRELASFAFLIEHYPSGRRLLFDLGTRKNYPNLPSETYGFVKEQKYDVKAPKHVIELLAEHGVEGSDVEAIVWSHCHPDYLGDPSLFPASTSLIVGPGFSEKYLPDYPDDSTASVLEVDRKGRKLLELKMDASSPQTCCVGPFRAHDYFGDGSFYLLDLPGHMTGHLGGLARTTTSSPSASECSGDGEDTFVLMAADAAHHGAELRPSKYHPLPKIWPTPILQEEPSSSVPSVLPQKAPAQSAGGRFRSRIAHIDPVSNPKSDAVRSTNVDLSLYPTPEAPLHLYAPRDIRPAYAELQAARGRAPDEPAFVPAIGEDREEARRTVDKIIELDGDERVLTVLAHDRSLRGFVRTFPEEMNGWFRDRVGEKVRWVFVRDLMGALEGFEEYGNVEERT